ncbi:hypothetical protein D3C75_515720 [compost metagenome]
MFRSQFIDIRQTFIDKLNRVVKQLVEIIRGITDVAGPLETEPFNIVLNGINVFDVFFYRVGVIETQVALALIILRDTKIQADGFCMADVQIAVWLWRETGANAGVLTIGQIFINNLANKVSWAGFGLTHRGFLCAKTLVIRP